MKYLIALPILLMTYSLDGAYVITKSAFSNAGNSPSSTHYVLKDAVGQDVTGEAQSTSFIEQAGFFTYSSITQIGITEEAEAHLDPFLFSLSPPFPNPAVKMITIGYGIPTMSHVRIKIYDITGRIIKTLVDAETEAGFYSLSWNREDDARHSVPNGVYFVRLEAGSEIATRKLIFVR
jgi:hypothetical protein